ncbi:Oxysterol-binding protein-domain-containing protein [Fomitopsis serialis]|uniref:Oxysterol-binding protein-domain-containing protein n=1 Tax=Fomitopsis serialis TaxID=139415 RepID=UPI0020082EBE|nr:Oxysterol-binding protein-domain-containing protein [Neoantrodia serialis]KAH9931318.1 Oxysterol-binding protein-domain-containing protein [Neoantrodia serialis]
MESVESHTVWTPDPLYQVKLLSALRSGDPARIHTFLSALNKDSRRSVEGDNDLGATALHLAIRCASTDTVALLLAHRAISPNSVHPPGSGTTALHLAASIARVEVVNLLLDQEGLTTHSETVRGGRALMLRRGRRLRGQFKDLIKLLSSPRIRHVDLSYLDESSGRTLLHEAVRRKDLRLVELAVRAGADVFARDRHGKAVYDSAGKDDRVKAFLRQFTNQDPSLLKPASDAEPPELKGYLNKYTNVAKGYNTRWFVLKEGVLLPTPGRRGRRESGSIAMKTAVLHISQGNSGLRFEVHSTGTRSNAQKWYLKANHRVEAARWTQALQKATEYARREGNGERKSGESDVPSLPSFSGAASIRGTMASTHVSRIKLADNVHHSGASSTVGGETESGDEGPSKHEKSLKESSDERDEEHESVAESEGKVPPHNNSFELQGSTLVAQVELASDLVSKIPVPDPSPRTAELRKAVEDTLQSVHGMLVEYVQMVKDREDWWKAKAERERERQNLWEESLQLVVQDSQTLEGELRKQSRRRSRMAESSYMSAMTHMESEGTIKARSPLVASPLSESASSFGGHPPSSPPPTPGLGVGMVRRPVSRQPSATSPIQSMMAASASRTFSATGAPPTADDDGMVDTDEEDEFFDAIDANNLPNLVVKPVVSDHLWITVHRDQYLGYLKLRERLAIDTDNRPPMSLWAVLKNSIGKDLTKISFPVFFNEPTSMLQRMAEDMEFSDCLDSAYAETDPHRRIAYVAAFAMSNYSSTIGRIAKPFNPMLSETFEYVSLDKDYRYVSEQVSHHPPMSACWAESPHWRYYGEVDAQNKFMGKSFEIHPTGVAHAELLLPKERAPDYPAAKGPHVEGRVIEHYSWKKVTTNVSGFILGSPTIDHYGDMVITNHRTGDKCVLTFKPRGWRGKDAYEICGYVTDVHGNVTYEMAGRWNSQLVARAVGAGIGQLHPDVKISGQDSTSSSPEYILLWRNSEKPTAPFNLTPFAITLNDCPDTLGPYVAPTDCRVRPDQRAFELGKYERANELKNKQEELQRATRKAREEGRLPPHRPRWFSAETEPDTGERVWTPSMINDELEYWIERDKVWGAKHVGQTASWKDVDRIFIEDEP